MSAMSAMSAQEWDRVIRLETKQAVGLDKLEGLRGSMERIHKSLDKMNDNLKEVLSQNDRHEERLAELQNITGDLAVTVDEVGKTCKRLRHVLFGFMAVLLALAFLVGLLGEEIAPKAMKWLWALIGM